MIRKPPNEWRRESASARQLRSAAEHLRNAASSGVAAATSFGNYARGVLLWSFALLWGFAALAGGLVGGSLPTLIGVGAMAAWAAWGGKRMFAKGKRL